MAKIAAIKISEHQMPWFFLMGEIEAREGDFCVVPRHLPCFAREFHGRMSPPRTD